VAAPRQLHRPRLQRGESDDDLAGGGCARGGVELVNLGLGGGALLDPVNTDLMRLRACAPAVRGFLDTLREGHPTAPLLVVSSLLCPVQEHTPGPSDPDLAVPSASGR